MFETNHAHIKFINSADPKGQVSLLL